MTDDPPDGYAGLEAAEEEIFQAMAEAYRAGDFDGAEELYRVWIKLPTKRVWRLGTG